MQLTGSQTVSMPLATEVRRAEHAERIGQGRAGLDAQAFERCMAPFAPFEQQPSLAVAVSGGPDSLALTLLAASWAKERGGRAIGLTVDHGLRPESAAEARQTAEWLAASGIEHHILAWRGEKPANGLQMRARIARYDRLTAWCREAGVLHLLTGHHLDDQAETLALRQARESGPCGLAGMASVRELRGLRLLRPLLGVDKASLKATLRALNQPWIEDPSNDDPRFARNRLRHQDVDTRSLFDEAAMWGKKRRASDQATARRLARDVVMDPAGFAHLPRQVVDDLAIDDAAIVLERILMTIGGDPYPPRRARLRRLLSEMKRPLPFKGRTLAHCRIAAWHDRWLFCSETTPTDRMSLTPHRWHRWDGRFMLRMRSERRDMIVRALDPSAGSNFNSLIPSRKPRRLPGMVRSTLPSIWRDREILAVPHMGLFDRTFDPSWLDLHFRPRHPLANAPFLPICLAS